MWREEAVTEYETAARKSADRRGARLRCYCLLDGRVVGNGVIGEVGFWLTAGRGGA